jgi:EAL domain-containing protein (putative c-di-GMP-specific phosphodiesterase class I)
MIVNLSDVKHLSMVTGCKFETSSVLLKILKESPQLSSISINPDVLISFFDDDELCKYLNKMIKKLDLKYCPINSLNDLYKLDKLWRIFSNVEQVTCRIEELLVDCLLSLLEHLPKLSRIDVSSQEFFCYSQSYSFMEELRKLGIEIIIDIEKGYNSISTIWIIRDMS